ncbi:inosine triphosphate pyrophosphatase-like protein [Mycena capillaripes]|nr:inosine triphosphate pyrophosphatase-like protein [Mycena capillaripes]
MAKSKLGELNFFVTGDANKLKEVKAILSAGGKPIEIESQSLDIPEIQGSTEELGAPCITEDTALCFEALKGLPGPYIKYFLADLSHESLNSLLVGFPTKAAWALCTFAYSAAPGTEPILFEGRTDGSIVPARGPGIFGWDAVFEPSGTGLTYAEMPTDQKNKLSHRYKALEKLREFLHSLD